MHGSWYFILEHTSPSISETVTSSVVSTMKSLKLNDKAPFFFIQAALATLPRATRDLQLSMFECVFL